ncbi:MAG: tagaturonate reductase [Saprospiraceae bacterium]|nr:tagaturonate reductase [Saprospiraceae bacterium]
MEQLSKKYLAGTPQAALMSLPEKVLQFGTGVLLRGLPDYLIDKANRQGIFNGRVVVVKSTDRGDAGAFDKQDNLYTLCTRGVENGQTVHRNSVCTAISRVLSANRDWAEVLACAADPQMRIVISNTTEVGIQLVREDVRQSPPLSFPGKLLAFLHARYLAFSGDLGMGVVIVPTELIPDNGKRLESIVFELAHLNRLELPFIEWVESACVFCNSLVDRIVPGTPPAAQATDITAELGYRDELLTVSEPYCFWAIEGDERVAASLSFQKAVPDAVVIAPDISRFRERKLRLLNGTHTLSCGLAWQAGFTTVSEAMNDAGMAAFVEQLMLDEIAPAIPCALPPGEAETFGRQVLDRFRNPFVEHRWLNITAQYASKMRMRVVPLLAEYYRTQVAPPQGMALGLAAFLTFYRHPQATVEDDAAGYFYEKWQSSSPEEMVQETLSDSERWGTDLSALPGFSETVLQYVHQILEAGARQTVQRWLQEKHETKSTADTLIG